MGSPKVRLSSVDYKLNVHLSPDCYVNSKKMLQKTLLARIAVLHNRVGVWLPTE